MRASYASLNARQWKDLYPNAILDEVQKEPSLIESIKSVYDQWSDPRYILLGSSQLLLLQKIKESLADSASIFEIFPLTLPELSTKSWDDDCERSIFIRMLMNDDLPELLPSSLLNPNYRSSKKHGIIIKNMADIQRFAMMKWMMKNDLAG